ncbi:hypothetical protein D922_03331 [Enterococcus faecalis 06-MB-DW-09]|nr:hypothetical protein D922_03331 [Enterococcus faecalis 06-MB-DW-09]
MKRVQTSPKRIGLFFFVPPAMKNAAQRAKHKIIVWLAAQRRY